VLLRSLACSRRHLNDLKCLLCAATRDDGWRDLGGWSKPSLFETEYATVKCTLFIVDKRFFSLVIRYTSLWTFNKIIIDDLFIVFNANFSNISAISWWPILVVEEAGIPGENHQTCANNWSALSFAVASRVPSFL
jgi:hypothetical protein